MENRNCTRNVALIEKCVMSGIGIQSLFNATFDSQYKLHLYLTLDDFQQAMGTTAFSAIIFSLLDQKRQAGGVDESDRTG